MSHTNHDKKKKFNFKDYKGYIAVLIGLFIILFVLIGIAIGMIRDYQGENPADSVIPETESFIEESESESETETVADREDPLLILINRDHPIQEGMTYELVRIEENYFIDERAYYDLMSMLSDAEKAGQAVVVCSAWRSHNLQTELYENKIDEYLSYGYSQKESEELAAFWVALPGTSEHEIGLAVDIVAESYQHLDHEQANTKEQQWLMEHCHEYGFILRYPEDKQDITLIGYEPWHYRYVGKEAAKDIKASGLCLEEYLNAVEVQ